MKRKFKAVNYTQYKVEYLDDIKDMYTWEAIAYIGDKVLDTESYRNSGHNCPELMTYKQWKLDIDNQIKALKTIYYNLLDKQNVENRWDN